MVKSVEDRDSRISDQQAPPDTAELDVPDTDDDWFSLCEPEIDVLPGEADENEVIDVAKQHAEQTIERTNMAVDLDLVEWRATRELRAKHGYHRNNFIKLSIDSLETNGWQEFLRVVRHELVHAWQHQNSIDDQEGKNMFERSHGSSFEDWMPILNIAKRGERLFPLWTIECPECQAALAMQQRARAKEIAQQIQTLNRETCIECGQQLSKYTVKRDGKEIAVESLPDVLSEAEDQIFLYNEPKTTSAEREWTPQTRRLTSFTGIGEATARTLGRHVNCIDELLKPEDRTLTTDVQSAVPALYHESLSTEIRACYDNALTHRSPDDLNLLDQVLSCRNYNWWQPIECLDETGTVESICLLLRNEIEPGDQIQITIDTHGEYTAQVVATAQAEIPTLGVTIDSDSTPLSSEGCIEVPVPQKGEHPTLRYEKAPPESGPTLGGSLSGSGFVVRRERITDVEKQETVP